MIPLRRERQEERKSARTAREARRLRKLTVFLGGLLVLAGIAGRGEERAIPSKPLRILVMDPLARPLTCDCVRGYAQRDYKKLGKFLEERLHREVSVVFSEDLSRVLKTGGDDLIIGKKSVVEFDAAEHHLAVRPLALLTDKRGRTTVTGLFVVPGRDRARRLSDLRGYKIILGNPEAAEKYAAPIAALLSSGVRVSESIATSPSCSDAALSVLEFEGKPAAAAVISSYALPLLEGCGAIRKGELRVVGSSAPVPFVTVFATESVAAADEESLRGALLSVRDDSSLLAALESKLGLVDFATDSSRNALQWSAFRGVGRTGTAPWLPEKLPAAPRFLWKRNLTGPGLSGIVATTRFVVVADRDAADERDIFRGLHSDTGAERWKLEYAAPGDLDYGNSPRATPVLRDGKVYLLGALGHLHCLTLADGKVVWKRNIVRDFGARLPTWGTCSSPLLVGDLLIVNPGGKNASLVALDRLTGKTVWKTAGGPAAYASFIHGRFGGVRQVIGYDQASLGGWDVASGRRLWSVTPPLKGDFNVPTAVRVGERILVTTEGNGARLYRFDRGGGIVPAPVATNPDLAAKTVTPVLVDGKLYGCGGQLLCLDACRGLKTLWAADDEAFEDHVSIIGSRDRLLLTSSRGELLLFAASGKRFELLSRLLVFGHDSEVLSHPALVGKRLYIRDDRSIACLLLGG